jgi:hypothetical protein
LLCASARADSIRLLSGSRLWQETDSGSDYMEVWDLPTQAESLVTGASGFGAASYDLFTDTFGFGFEHSSDSEQFYGRSVGDLYFLITEDTPYRFGTSFTSTGGAEWTGFLDLRDLTDGSTFFADVAHNNGHPLPGVVPDDASGQTEGNPMGMLPAGHKFHLRYILYTTAGGQSFRDGGFEPGLVTVNLNTLFRESVVVPLPQGRPRATEPVPDRWPGARVASSSRRRRPALPESASRGDRLDELIGRGPSRGRSFSC